jgi:hypothetical protein
MEGPPRPSRFKRWDEASFRWERFLSGSARGVAPKAAKLRGLGPGVKTGYRRLGTEYGAHTVSFFNISFPSFCASPKNF